MPSASRSATRTTSTDRLTPSTRRRLRYRADVQRSQGASPECGAAVGRATARPASTTTTPHNIYRVKRGDTLSKIANQFQVSISAIVARNHIANPDPLHEGQTLVIPPLPPRKLVVSPQRAPGSGVSDHADRRVPSETIKFQIDSAEEQVHGRTARCVGRRHGDRMYQTALSDPTGAYTVTATGNRGTTSERPSLSSPPQPRTPPERTCIPNDQSV